MHAPCTHHTGTPCTHTMHTYHARTMYTHHARTMHTTHTIQAHHAHMTCTHHVGLACVLVVDRERPQRLAQGAIAVLLYTAAHTQYTCSTSAAHQTVGAVHPPYMGRLATWLQDRPQYSCTQAVHMRYLGAGLRRRRKGSWLNLCRAIAVRLRSACAVHRQRQSRGQALRCRGSRCAHSWE